MHRLLAVLFLALVSPVALADLPENDLWKEDYRFELAQMTESTFNKILDEIEAVYTPIVAGLGGNLVLVRDWQDPTVNAYARKSGTDWEVKMFGGLARRPEVTPDGFALVVCHELGHHIAGYPFYAGSNMASEGVSDWFATNACARRIWKVGLKSGARAAAAGQSLAALLATLNKEPKPSPSTPDTSIAKGLLEGHPKAQARLDTYLAGIACKTEFPISFIPGLGASGIGDNTLAVEAQVKTVHCLNFPLSWYAAPLK